MSRCKKPSSSW